MLLLILSANSCKQCKDCQNGGTCINAKCICTENYSGDHCEKDLCVGVVCNNGGTCKGGLCKCAAGYQGIHCDELVTDLFTDSFHVIQTVGSSTTTYEAKIYANGPPSLLQLKIKPTYHGLTVYGTVKAYENTIEIFHQSPAGYTDVYGSGTYSGGELNMLINYDSTDAAPPVSVRFKMQRVF